MSLPTSHLVPLGLGLAWAFFNDLWRRRVPNAATGFVFLSGLTIRVVDGAGQGAHGAMMAVLSGLAATALVLVALLRPWSAGGLGGGDVKLAAATAAWVGLGKLLWFALGTAFTGGIVALACYLLAPAPARAEIRANVTLAALHAELPSVPSHRKGHISVPYALAIAAGAAVAFLIA